jgi:Anti-sigma-28 factor, FlgM
MGTGGFGSARSDSGSIDPRSPRAEICSEESGTSDQTMTPRSDTSLAALKRSIARGEYAVDPGVLAEAILWKVGTVRRVRRQLSSDEADGDDRGAGRIPERRSRRRSRPGSRPPLRPRPGQPG